MNEKKMFVKRYGRDVYDAFIYYLRDDAVTDHNFGILGFYVQKGSKNRKRLLERVMYQNATKSLCAETLKHFDTREALIAHMYTHRNEFGFYFDSENALNLIWRTDDRRYA